MDITTFIAAIVYTLENAVDKLLPKVREEVNHGQFGSIYGIRHYL